MDHTDNLSLQKNSSKNRFEVTIGGMTAFVDYIEMGKKIIYTHTEVPIALEGKGLGSALARGVMEYARENNLQVIPLCPFIGTWLRKHTEYQDILANGVSL
ncbi:MAG: N-acetyltransferase [Ignavibacteriae bacterium]|nr:N-acetyltransferase [Ignavibacteriota bacterium]MCB9214330.1 N-acetyltransferase [Ignavibacteria bacterium]